MPFGETIDLVIEKNNVKINISSKGVKVNDASVVAADVQASNGVVHVIDKVILPPTE